jgi:hypothetical protein
MLRPALRGKRAKQREHSKEELDAARASQATEACKQQSSSATAGALAAGIGQNRPSGYGQGELIHHCRGDRGNRRLQGRHPDVQNA